MKYSVTMPSLGADMEHGKLLKWYIKPGDVIKKGDLIAMVETQKSAVDIESFRSGTVLELITYRLSDHTTADDARRYRDDEQVKQAWTREPIKRLKNYLMAKSWWSEQEEQEWIVHSNAWADAEVDAYLATTVQPLESMFDYLYAEAPHDVAEQRGQALAWEKR
jgi:pyruvate dehydrogenase E1 component alpha subunit